MVTDDERRQLLAIARDAIAFSLGKITAQRTPPPAGALAGPGGAFVTIRLHGQLRGCIGYIESPMPLANVVAEVAVKSARQDPRFSPLTPDELEKCTLEVSVLSTLRKVADEKEICIGVHGLLLESRGRRGLLLPQVAVENGWDVPEFLKNTCRKSGLKDEAWKEPGATLFLFTAEVASEEHARP